MQPHRSPNRATLRSGGRGARARMRQRLLMVAMTAAVLSAPTISQAALPPEILSVGVTEAAWNTVQLQVKRAAAEKHVSERALTSVCLKMGVQLAKGQRLDINQLIGMVDARADEVTALRQRLATQAQDSDPTTSGFLQQARVAVDSGELDQAERLLDQAEDAASKAIDNAQRRRA